MSGDTLLILLNAHFECVPFVLPAPGDSAEWVRILDTIDAHPPELRFGGRTKYSLQGRSVALFTLEMHRGHRRASDHADDVQTHDRVALQVTH